MKKICRTLSQSLPLGLASLALLSGCSLLPRSASHTPGRRAFIAYWPPAESGGALRLAVKDNIDIKGRVTSAGSEYLLKNSGPAKADAACLAGARQRKVQIVGKTNLSEFAVSPSGYNEYFGTPKSPLARWKKLIPGGSSCGSAVAVAVGLADVSFGTDTAGSVRVPAACCGIVGLKTTHGLVPVDGVHPIEPEHLDTVGPMGRDIANTVKGMDLLQSGFAGRYEAAMAAKPAATGIRVARLKLKGTNAKIDAAVDQALARTGFQVVPLDGEFNAKWEQAQKDGYTIAAAGAWMSNRQFIAKTGVSTRTKAIILFGKTASGSKYRQAVARQREWQRTLRAVFRKADFIALPTLQSTPPVIPPVLEIGVLEALMVNLQNTVPVNFAGNPALAMPVPLRRAGVRATSLQLIGPPRSEAALLNAGRLVEAAVARE